jgi:hypothetical protein
MSKYKIHKSYIPDFIAKMLSAMWEYAEKTQS